MPNHPNRRARGGPSPSGLLLRDLRERAGLTQAQAGALVRVSEIAWRSWENGARRMPAPAMELLCIVLSVGTVEHGPYVPPGDWMLPWVRGELCLRFRRPSERSAPPDPDDMRAFADRLMCDPNAARAFFHRAGILDDAGNLTPAYTDEK